MKTACFGFISSLRSVEAKDTREKDSRFACCASWSCSQWGSLSSRRAVQRRHFRFSMVPWLEARKMTALCNRYTGNQLRPLFFGSWKSAQALLIFVSKYPSIRRVMVIFYIALGCSAAVCSWTAAGRHTHTHLDHQQRGDSDDRAGEKPLNNGMFLAL